jgi:hypothetical protein
MILALLLLRPVLPMLSSAALLLLLLTRLLC